MLHGWFGRDDKHLHGHVGVWIAITQSEEQVLMGFCGCVALFTRPDGSLAAEPCSHHLRCGNDDKEAMKGIDQETL